MSTITSLTFEDRETGDGAFISVRISGDLVGLTVALQSDGDVEVFLGPYELTTLIEGLTQAQSRLAAG